jgi:hypothetical protein
VGDPDSVMRIAEFELNVMEVSRVNETVAVVVVALIWEPRVTVGPVIELVMAENVPVRERSRMVVPSLVVPASTAVIAGCAAAGRVNCANFKTIAVPPAKLPPPFTPKRIFNTYGSALSMEGVHVAKFAGAVTVHAGELPMVGDPDSVMRIAELAVDVIEVVGVNETVAVVVVALIWEPRVTAGPEMVAYILL